MTTALVNRLGDVGLLICRGLMFSLGHWTFTPLRVSTRGLDSYLVLILILAACTKRAQIPFSAWLPAAIAAPTPVSALVHSSTLVTAGVYLLIRFNILYLTRYWRNFLILLGAMTILIAGLAAIFEKDLKKIIALSTLSQLGIMIITLGGQAPLLAYFHLLSHAFFKAILFICAGIIIHNIKEYQDLRKGGRTLPITVRVISISNISLCGLPFLRGFYSKDLILEIILMQRQSLIFGLILFLATFLTVVYSCRLFLSFRRDFKFWEKSFFQWKGNLNAKWDTLFISFCFRRRSFSELVPFSIPPFNFSTCLS